MEQNHELIDNVDENQYEMHVGKDTVKIEYIKTQNGEIYLTHTETPIGLEGQGLASEITGKVLEDIEQKGLRLVPLCPFVVGYIQKNPEWRKLVIR
ncbi:MAG TPA: N-acetyltransferase [Dysgonomonas sp.]|nr:N-acetyltransferase [Dysgonomonas sp.]